MTYPCPACGKPTRICQDVSMRICSICRKVSLSDACILANVPRSKPTDDSVGARDKAFGWLDLEVVAPLHPCFGCGRETKNHHNVGERSCKSCGLISKREVVLNG